MSEPLRTISNAGPPDEADGVDRETRIEQLLLGGLDQYFAGQYEQAIDIWTRVAFLERRHRRARAYIDRARSALAERQRESEELLHRGVAEYRSGRLQAARELLTRAVDTDGPSDTALVFLQHLGRLQPSPSPIVASSGFGSAEAPGVTPLPTTRSTWVVTSLASVAVAAIILVAARPIASFVADLPVAGSVSAMQGEERLPIVRTSDMLLARARDLHVAGRPHEALRLLARIDPADPVGAEADRLRADVQSVLLVDAARGTDGLRQR